MTTIKRHPRTAAEAFKDADYAGAVYRYPGRRMRRLYVVVFILCAAMIAWACV